MSPRCRACGGEWHDPDDPRPLVHVVVNAVGISVECARCGHEVAAVLLDDVAPILDMPRVVPPADPARFTWSTQACAAAGFVPGFPGMRWRALPGLPPDRMWLTSPDVDRQRIDDDRLWSLVQDVIDRAR